MHTRRPVKQQSTMWTDFVVTHVATQQNRLHHHSDQLRHLLPEAAYTLERVLQQAQNNRHTHEVNQWITAPLKQRMHPSTPPQRR